MNLEEILKNKELAVYRKKSEIQKTDFSNVLFENANKALSNGTEKIEVLVYEAEISSDRNKFMFDQYMKGYVLNHSIGMRYLKLFFCYKSDEPEHTQENENYLKYEKFVLNKDDLREHFWAIVEAKNIEASAVVKGSNFLTPVLSINILDEKTIKVKLAISPCNILDSHGDVHIPGLWKKSTNEGNYDLLLQEHEMDFDKVIVDSLSGNLKVFIEMISVKELLSKFKENKSIEAVTDTSKDEPTLVTQNEQQKFFINLIQK